MSDIGILSMQRIINYGSFLQAFALKSMLENYGHKVQFVDYHPGRVPGAGKRQSRIHSNISRIMQILLLPAPLSHRLAYIRFKRQFAGRYHSLLGLSCVPNFSPDVDILVIGSDEVFNCTQKNPAVGFTPELFGAGSRADKTVTYAASFGNTTMERLEKFSLTGGIAGFLGQMEGISVRDENSRQIVEQLTGRTPEVHLDPVLVCDFTKGAGIRPVYTGEDYLILYGYPGRFTREECRAVRSYAQKNHLKIYTAGGVQQDADRFLDCSPFTLLSYFSGAKAVVTDTFHGTVFSVITERPFVTLIRKSSGTSYGNEEKLTDLLCSLHLSDRHAAGPEMIAEILEQPPDYRDTRKILAKERLRTEEYLRAQTGGTV